MRKRFLMSAIQQLLRVHGVYANKRLGQNFIFDQNITGMGKVESDAW
jgi:hypothetical protein